VKFLVDKVALEQVLLPALPFSLVSIIPAMLHTHLYLNIALIRTQNPLSEYPRVLDRKVLLYFLLVLSVRKLTAISGYGAHVTSANMRKTNLLDRYQQVKEKTNNCGIYALLI
jgi:hypothetical protein